jgi:prepilin-type processing-associated H-X9-DG protein
MRRSFTRASLWLEILAVAGLTLAQAGCSKSTSSGGSSSDTPVAIDNAKGKGDHSNGSGRDKGKMPEFGDDPVSRVNMAANKAKSQNNLKMIGIAMHNYLSAYNTFPPAVSCDPQGRPLWSWRVLILPYIEEGDLYKQFKLQEPWDSEHNKKLIPKMPKVYWLPNAGKQSDGLTHYRALASVPSEAGNDAAAFNWFDPKQPGPLRGNGIHYFLDGFSSTILVAEAADGVEWTKPDELIYHPKKPVPALGYAWRGNCNVLFGDGSIRSISDKVSEATLRALITARASDIPGNDY